VDELTHVPLHAPPFRGKELTNLWSHGLAGRVDWTTGAHASLLRAHARSAHAHAAHFRVATILLHSLGVDMSEVTAVAFGTTTLRHEEITDFGHISSATSHHGWGSACSHHTRVHPLHALLHTLLHALLHALHSSHPHATHPAHRVHEVASIALDATTRCVVVAADRLVSPATHLLAHLAHLARGYFWVKKVTLISFDAASGLQVELANFASNLLPGSCCWVLKVTLVAFDASSWKKIEFTDSLVDNRGNFLGRGFSS